MTLELLGGTLLRCGGSWTHGDGPQGDPHDPPPRPPRDVQPFELNSVPEGFLRRM